MRDRRGSKFLILFILSIHVNETDEREAMFGYILHLNVHPPALPDTR